MDATAGSGPNAARSAPLGDRDADAVRRWASTLTARTSAGSWRGGAARRAGTRRPPRPTRRARPGAGGARRRSVRRPRRRTTTEPRATATISPSTEAVLARCRGRPASSCGVDRRVGRRARRCRRGPGLGEAGQVGGLGGDRGGSDEGVVVGRGRERHPAEIAEVDLGPGERVASAHDPQPLGPSAPSSSRSRRRDGSRPRRGWAGRCSARAPRRTWRTARSCRPDLPACSCGRAGTRAPATAPSPRSRWATGSRCRGCATRWPPRARRASPHPPRSDRRTRPGRWAAPGSRGVALGGRGVGHGRRLEHARAEGRRRRRRPRRQCRRGRRWRTGCRCRGRRARRGRRPRAGPRGWAASCPRDRSSSTCTELARGGSCPARSRSSRRC